MKIIITAEEYLRYEALLEKLSLDLNEKIRCESPEGDLIMIIGGRL